MVRLCLGSWLRRRPGASTDLGVTPKSLNLPRLPDEGTGASLELEGTADRSPGSKDPKSLKTSGPGVDGSGHLLAGEAGCTLEESLYTSAFPVLRFSRGWFWSPALAQEFRWNPADACQCRPVVKDSPRPCIKEGESTCFFLRELSKLGPQGGGAAVLQLPVDYREVTQRVTRIWEDLQPQGNGGWGVECRMGFYPAVFHSSTFMRGGRRGIPEVVPARCGVGAALGPGLVLPRLGPSATSGKAEQASVSLCSRSSLVLLQLVVHIGLDASPKANVLEQRAKNRGSWDADVRGFRPSRGEGLPDGPEVIASGVSTRALGKLVAVEGAQVLCSRHAGRCAWRGRSPGGWGGRAAARPAPLPGRPPSPPEAILCRAAGHLLTREALLPSTALICANKECN
uniref:LOW QUALITY PROTEIN: pyroglutamyl-peptidase 1-like protein n=1 Tax=Panthera onca TaxID=9690 RepID=UPI0029554D49|nr:LOW QUALITY PROTEIN: pyroglutamyl-peptidase 1-like protein [Panthera onca]